MRRLSLAVLVLLLLGTLAPGLSSAPAGDPPVRPDPPPKTRPGQRPVEGYGSLLPDGRPTTPNPYLSFLPADVAPDYAGWDAWLRQRSAEVRRRRQAEVRAFADVTESEQPTEQNLNDTLPEADPVPGFGTGPGDSSETAARGTVAPPPEPTVLDPLEVPDEDDGDITLATPLALELNERISVRGATIGDGPHGSGRSGSGDFDFYRIEAPAHARLTVDVDTEDPFGDLDPFVGLYRRTGEETAELVASNDDDFETFDSLLEFPVPESGEYFVSVGGFGSFLLEDPFDSGSGPGAGSEGDYDLTASLLDVDVDVFAVELEAGDVLGATLVSGDPDTVTALGPDETVLMGSSQDASFIYPLGSPLEGGGPHLAVVAGQAGTYGVSVTGPTGGYELALQAFRPGTERMRTDRRATVFLDFDGATLDAGALFGFGNPAAALSPLSSFLGRWGLEATDEDAVVDAVVATVEENLEEDLRGHPNGDFGASGTPGDFDVEVRNSRDHDDPGARADTMRLIVGGSIDELHLPTIGIAQSIDPGNFAPGETAVVLLDVLSEPDCGEFLDSLNCIPLTDGASMVDLVGTAVGNIAAHEAGHLLGAFHTDQFNPVNELMDQGGNLPNTIGLGPDGEFGGADDVDVDFVGDVYVPNEGFLGIEDTRAITAHGHSSGTDTVNDPPVATRDVLPFTGGPVAADAPGILRNDHDPEFDPVSAQLVGAPRGGVIEAFRSDGSFTLRPEAVRDLTFTYRASDGDLVSEPVTVTVAVRDCTDRDLRNGSFELGLDFWCVQDLRDPFFPVSVVPAGASTDFGAFGFFRTEPTDGDLVALHGFDGAGPGTIELFRFVRPDPRASEAELSLDWRAAWDLATFCEDCSARSFDVVVEDALTGLELRRERLLVAHPGTIVTDTGPRSASVDLGDLVGVPLRISLEATVPDAFSGPGQLQIDAVDLDVRRR